jgi:hypothetical protein
MNELKNLYRLGFPEDSEGDVEYFFKEKIRDAKIFSYSEGGKILSAAYIFKRKLRIFADISFSGTGAANLKSCDAFKDIEIPFMVAAATLPEFRGKKIFHNVMRDIFSHYSDEPFIALYPFKHEYYNKNFGFENFNYLPFADGQSDDFCSESVDCLSSAEKKRLPKILTEIYSSYAENFDAYILRDGEYFEKKIAEWRASGGEIGLIFPKEPDGVKTKPNCLEKSDGGEIGLAYLKKSESFGSMLIDNRQEKKPVGYVFFTKDCVVEERCFINFRVEEKFYGKTTPLRPAMMIKILNVKKASEFFYPRSFSDLKTFSLEKY